jgi:hypothetical protein
MKVETYFRPEELPENPRQRRMIFSGKYLETTSAALAADGTRRVQ